MTDTTQGGEPGRAADGGRPRGRLLELDVEQCWARLKQSVVGRLAINDERGPLILPVNIAVDVQTVLFRTGDGSKLRAALSGQRAALEVDGVVESQHTGWSVLVRGSLHEVQGFEQVRDAMATLEAPYVEGDRHRLVRLRPTSVTGREIAVVDDPAARGPGPDVGHVWSGTDASDLMG